jgi:hypothetical protein
MSKPVSTVEEAEALLNRCKALSHRVSIYAKRLVGEQDALAVEIKSLQANVQSLRKATPAVQDRQEQQQISELLSEAADTINGVGPGGDL